MPRRGGHSQETRCREFARMKGYTVAAVFRDDVSGSRINRPGMKEALTYLRKHRAHEPVMVIDDVSRLARGLEQHLHLRSLIANAGGVLESPSIEFGEDSDSILVENLLASVSQHQRQKNGEQTVNRMRARVLNGYWPFQAPIGYKYKPVSGRGKILVRDEPVASVIQEALEGYAGGRFETQAEVMRFFQTHPLFPKGAQGIVRNQAVAILMRNPLYAGYVQAPKWEVPLREGQHEGLISYATLKRIQERLDGAAYAPRQRNLNDDFPLRGYILCDDCGSPLTACWSRGSHGHYAYYLCPKRGCGSYGKSIRRDTIEREFERLLKSVQPSGALFTVAKRMMRAWWDGLLANADGQARELRARLNRIENDADALLKRIVEVREASVITAYEGRIRQLQEEKLALKERISHGSRPVSSFEDTLRTALTFLATPWNLWSSGRLEDRRTVLKLTFGERLRYARNEGFRTANLSLPFKVLSAMTEGENEMASPTGFEPVLHP